MVLLLVPLLLQAPGDGWAITDSKPGEIRRIYWDLSDTTEAWVMVRPSAADAEGSLRLIFQAFSTGRLPKGPPSRLALRVVGPAVADLSLRLVIDGTTFELTGPEGSSRPLFPAPSCPDCSANGVDAELKADVLRSLVSASRAEGRALGVPFVISHTDQRMLLEFALEVGIPNARRAR